MSPVYGIMAADSLLFPMDINQGRSVTAFEVAKDAQEVSAAGLQISTGTNNVRVLLVREVLW